MPTVDELRAAIGAKGDEIRQLKAAGGADLQPHIAELLKLKEDFKEANGGVPFDPPKQKKEKKKKQPQEQKQPAEGEMSKGAAKKAAK
eukprot:CAMPEP_0118875416 /NCGR_PEP_ID=MMETSP1163-20130328/16499_1 /TAXON_ID=124430 /ORGANISM="Phaeomonas parva, Strain CCMP2877" /LENGTH=87 /DNA_ID=CAMNT_0006810921 /DNA_START=180 /DNA_END=440 /DNA_ORIENTATION=+